MVNTNIFLKCLHEDTYMYSKKLFFPDFSRREDISKCLYEYRVIITCYKKN